MSITDETYPSVSFIIPVLNAEKLLPECLGAIERQDYPKNKIEIIIADGKSTDSSLKIASQYNAKVFINELRTSESGKAVGIKNAQGELIVFIDADNMLPDSGWLKTMVTPLIDDPELIGSEPLYFTYRKEDGFIDRYCALIGMNDPLCMWIGSYDRMNILTNTWTGLKVKTSQKNNYTELILEKGNIPTIGANGTVLRRTIFLDNPNLFDKYLFDMDVLEQLVSNNGPQKFAKVNTGIVHKYCGSDLSRFAKKQLRRVKDWLYRAPVKEVFITRNFEKRKYTYGHKSGVTLGLSILGFILYCILVFPLIIQAIIGYTRKPDYAWFMHPVLCWITLIVYARGTIESLFKNEELNRDKW